MSDIKTLSEFIVERQNEFTGATGDLSSLLTAFRLAAKIVNREVNKAGLLEDILGAEGTENIQGEQQQKLDVYANDMFIRICAAKARCALWPAKRTMTSSTSRTAASTSWPWTRSVAAATSM